MIRKNYGIKIYAALNLPHAVARALAQIHKVLGGKGLALLFQNKKTGKGVPGSGHRTFMFMVQVI